MDNSSTAPTICERASDPRPPNQDRGRVIGSQRKEESYGPLTGTKIDAANSALVVSGKLDAVGNFFTPDYVAHLMGQQAIRGHGGIRKLLTCGGVRSPILRSRSRSSSRGRTESPGNGRTEESTRRPSWGFLQPVVDSCGATWVRVDSQGSHRRGLGDQRSRRAPAPGTEPMSDRKQATTMKPDETPTSHRANQEGA